MSKNKCCAKCKIWKPRSEFWALKEATDGLQYRCKDCQRSAESNSYQARVLRQKVKVEEKRCPRCGETKKAEEFALNRAAKDGLAGYCKKCNLEYAKAHPPTEATRARQRERARERGLERFGLTIDDYDRMLAVQGGGCAICRTTSCTTGKRLGVDHDNETGVVRGLLCRRCNQAIGEFDHDPALLRAAAVYLEVAMAKDQQPN